MDCDLGSNIGLSACAKPLPEGLGRCLANADRALREELEPMPSVGRRLEMFDYEKGARSFSLILPT
jgi:hypothetical protein